MASAQIKKKKLFRFKVLILAVLKFGQKSAGDMYLRRILISSLRYLRCGGDWSEKNFSFDFTTLSWKLLLLKYKHPTNKKSLTVPVKSPRILSCFVNVVREKYEKGVGRARPLTGVFLDSVNAWPEPWAHTTLSHPPCNFPCI